MDCLQREDIPGAEYEVEELLGHVLSKPRRAWRLDPDRPLTQEQDQRFRDLVERRARRVPLQYVIGQETFCGMFVEVTPDVLIPRPETEGVVDAARRALGDPTMAAESPVIVDIGTGSGCIALVLAREFPDAVVYATDCSRAALAVARRNAERQGLANRIVFCEGDLFDPLIRGGVIADLVVSNPPYVAEEEWPVLQPEVRCEPRCALNGGAGGLEYYRRIAAEATMVLAKDGIVVLEIGYGQAEAVRLLMEKAGFDVERIVPDDQGIPRVVVAWRRHFA